MVPGSRLGEIPGRRSNGIGEADRRIVQREGAGKNSYRSSHVKALVWPAAYLLALDATNA